VTSAAVDVEAPQLDFQVEQVGAVEHAVVPTLAFAIRIDAGGHEIRSLALDVQVRIAATRRRYDDAERQRLFELFGAPGGWDRSLRNLRWTTAPLNVSQFTGSTTAELPVPCTYDFDVVATKYLHALTLGGGDVPLELLFSGTVFYSTAAGLLQTAQIPASAEADYRLPVAVWRETMDRHFPGAVWLRVDRETFERLHAYRSRHALPSWEATLHRLLGDE